MLTLNEQIVVMQHASDGGAVSVLNRDRSLNHVVFNATNLNFDWNDLDYEIYIPPDAVFGKRFADGSMVTFIDQKEMDDDPTEFEFSGKYYLLDRRSIKILVDAGILERK